MKHPRSGFGVVGAFSGLLALSCGGPNTPTAATKTPSVDPVASGTASAANDLDRLILSMPAGIQARWNAASDEHKQQRRAQWEALPQATRDRMLRTAERSQNGRQRSASVGGDVVALNDPPDAVFRTTPPANAEGEIRGLSPFEVTFNQCPSRDVDPGDELKYKYDYEGLGFFIRGGCRETYTYLASFGDPRVFEATVCVSDRQPEEGHEICKTYSILVAGGETCRTITAGETALPTGSTTVFDGSFNVAGGSTVIAGIGVRPTTATYFTNGWNSFNCGGGPWSNAGVFAWDWDPPIEYSSWNNPFTAAGDYVGCRNNVQFYSFDPGVVGSWSTEVCDPGAF